MTNIKPKDPYAKTIIKDGIKYQCELLKGYWGDSWEMYIYKDGVLLNKVKTYFDQNVPDESQRTRAALIKHFTDYVMFA